MAFSGGATSRPTTSAALAVKCGSLLSHQDLRAARSILWLRKNRQTYWTSTSPSSPASRGPVQRANPAGGGLSSNFKIRLSVDFVCQSSERGCRACRPAFVIAVSPTSGRRAHLRRRSRIARSCTRVVGGCSIAALVGVVRRLAPPALDLQLGKTAVQGLINGGRRIDRLA